MADWPTGIDPGCQEGNAHDGGIEHNFALGQGVGAGGFPAPCVAHVRENVSVAIPPARERASRQCRSTSHAHQAFADGSHTDWGPTHPPVPSIDAAAPGLIVRMDALQITARHHVFDGHFNDGRCLGVDECKLFSLHHHHAFADVFDHRPAGNAPPVGAGLRSCGAVRCSR